MYVAEKITVSAYSIPTDFPESDGTIRWDKTTLILVEIFSENIKGIGFTYADISTALFIEKHLAPIVLNQNVFDINKIWNELNASIRNVGQCGVGMMAISAIDTALWDLKSRLLLLPLATLFGQNVKSVPAYYSGGFTSYNKERLQAWTEQGLRLGFSQFKIKIGREPTKDIFRVRDVRNILPSHAELFVDANGAYNAKQALALATAFDKYHVSWFEEPVPSSNLDGLHFIRQQVSTAINIAAGEYGYTLPYFKKMLNAHAVDILQADATRCGGYTGFLKVAALSEAFEIPFSSHCGPSIHNPVVCSLNNFYSLEYFYDHARIEQLFFEGFCPAVNGFLAPNLNSVGSGLILKKQIAEKFIVFKKEIKTYAYGH